MRNLFWIEIILGSVSTLLFIATLLWPDWLELILHIDPDYGNGSVEWMIVALAGVAAITCFALARMEWLKVRVATTSS